MVLERVRVTIYRETMEKQPVFQSGLRNSDVFSVFTVVLVFPF